MNRLFFYPVLSVMVMVLLITSLASGAVYQEGPVARAGTVEGHVSFIGDAPEPKIFQLRNFPNKRYCRKISDGKGNRILEEVRVDGDGRLQDAVIYFPEIKSGKPIFYKGTNVTARDCQFLVQDGPSTFTGVVMKNKMLRLLNDDADPEDPALVLGIAHNPQGFEISGVKIRTIFKTPLTVKGRVIKKKVKLTENNSFVKLECDLHDYMQTYFLPVENPYYAVVGKDGEFRIEGIPPGTHKIVAWHPILGIVEREIHVPPEGKSTVELTFMK